MIADEDVRVAVYRRYAETGLEPTVGWLAAELDSDEDGSERRFAGSRSNDTSCSVPTTAS